MAEERFVTYYPDDGRWGLGLAAYELGTGYLLGDPLSRQAAGILVRLAAETGVHGHRSARRHRRRGLPHPHPGGSHGLGGRAVRGPLTPPT